MSKVHDEFSCSVCGVANAAYGYHEKQFCSICMPADVISAFTSTMEAKVSMKFKIGLKRRGNRALNGRTSDGR